MKRITGVIILIIVGGIMYLMYKTDKEKKERAERNTYAYRKEHNLLEGGMKEDRRVYKQQVKANQIKRDIKQNILNNEEEV